MRSFKNIVFIGFASCGKTACGRETARQLGYRFVDLDDVIEERFAHDEGRNLTCREIYTSEGPRYFSWLETSALRGLADLKKMTLSTGGGAPMTQANRPILKRLGFTVYLYAELPILLKRMENKGYPAYLAGNPSPNTMRKIWSDRHAIYGQCADVTIDTNTKTITEAVAEATKAYEQHSR